MFKKFTITALLHSNLGLSHEISSSLIASKGSWIFLNISNSFLNGKRGKKSSRMQRKSKRKIRHEKFATKRTEYLRDMDNAQQNPVALKRSIVWAYIQLCRNKLDSRRTGFVVPRCAFTIQLKLKYTIANVVKERWFFMFNVPQSIELSSKKHTKKNAK